MKEYYLVTDADAAQVEAATGLRGRDTPLGVLVEKPKPFRLEVEMEKLERAMRGPRCCYGVVLHEPSCKFWCTAT